MLTGATPTIYETPGNVVNEAKDSSSPRFHVGCTNGLGNWEAPPNESADGERVR